MAEERFDLVVRGGTVVTPGRQEVADIGVRDGRIAQLGGAMTGIEEAPDHTFDIEGGIAEVVTLVVTRALPQPASDEYW